MKRILGLVVVDVNINQPEQCLKHVKKPATYRRQKPTLTSKLIGRANTHTSEYPHEPTPT